MLKSVLAPMRRYLATAVRFASNLHPNVADLVSMVPSPRTSSSSVQNEEGWEAFTDVAPFPMLVFSVVFFAVAPGEGAEALATCRR